MEFLVSPTEYLFVRESSLLRCCRQTGAVRIEATGANQPLTKGFTCLGRIHGLVGCLSIPEAKSGYLLLVSGQEFVGQHPLTKNSIYKVERVSAVPWKCLDRTLHPLESNELPPCRLHQKQPVKGPGLANAQTMIEPFKYVSSRAVKSLPPFMRSRVRSQVLDDVLRLFNNNGSFYYCSLADLTNSVQCLISKGGSKVSLSKRFFWNRHSANCFLENVQPSCSLEDCVSQGFLCAMINGHVSVLIEGNVSIAVISRRSIYRAGTRYLKRGIDADGFCANYVETEQVVRAFDHISSFVLVRGSVPAFWAQSGYKYRPPPLVLKSKAETMAAFRKHIDEQIALYGSKLILVNLVDPNSKEKPLDDVYIDLVLDSEDERIVYVAFNFNDHCRGLHFENVSFLITALQNFIVESGFCWVDKNGDAVCLQKGVFRVNCVECLDRTNLVQTAIAKHKLEEQLTRFGMLLPDENLNAQLERAFRVAWANNGDSISRQYVGTDALKGDYTRTGERKFVGLVKDGYHSASRYYLSHVKDYRRQMSIDCLLGLSDVESALYFKNEEEELKKWTDCKEEEMRQMIKDCERLLVSKDEVVIGSWALVSASTTTKDIDSDMDTVIVLTREAYYVADYDEDLDKFLHFQKVPLQSITKIEVGSMTVSVTLGFARSKATCIRISFINENYETLTHVWRSASTRLFNGVVIAVDSSDEAEENLLAIVEQFRVALNLANLVVPIQICDQLERKGLAKSVLSKTKDGFQAFGFKLASVNGTLRLRRSSRTPKNDVSQSKVNESVVQQPTCDAPTDGTQDSVIAPHLTPEATANNDCVVDHDSLNKKNTICSLTMGNPKLSLCSSRSDQSLMASSWNSIGLQTGTFSSSCQNFITQVGKQLQQTAQKTIAGVTDKPPALVDRYAAYRERVARSPSVFILL
uniref:SAC domain-containing protein n=1 Tax=Trichuris muris TaxID=70415 RepID=A0A5S6QD13_TRIMR